jgi:hypothetical protein
MAATEETTEETETTAAAVSLQEGLSTFSERWPDIPSIILRFGETTFNTATKSSSYRLTTISMDLQN